MYIEGNGPREQKYYPRVAQQVRAKTRPGARSGLSLAQGNGLDFCFWEMEPAMWESSTRVDTRGWLE